MYWTYALSNTQGSSVERKDTEVLLLNVKKGQCGWWGLIQLSLPTENQHGMGTAFSLKHKYFPQSCSKESLFNTEKGLYSHEWWRRAIIHSR